MEDWVLSPWLYILHLKYFPLECALYVIMQENPPGNRRVSFRLWRQSPMGAVVQRTPFLSTSVMLSWTTRQLSAELIGRVILLGGRE
jgi:hypothetical protein